MAIGCIAEVTTTRPIREVSILSGVPSIADISRACGAGATDRRYTRRDDYRDESYYRSGTYGYQSYVDRDQYQYYYREGFERGYRDGYTDQSRFGTYSGGKWSILTTVLNGILNLRSF